MPSLQQVVIDALCATGASEGRSKFFTHGDGRFITPTTFIHLPDGGEAMFCGLNFNEKKAVLKANHLGGGRWLADGSFTMFKKDMA